MTDDPESIEAATTSVLVEPAARDDADAVARLIRISKADAMPWLAVPHTPDEDRAWVRDVLLPGHEVVVARDLRHGAVGVVAYRTGWLDQLYVATSAQGRGVGAMLLEHALSHAGTPVQLWAFQRNLLARRFYERRGFVEVRRTDGAGNEEREPDVLYRWEPSLSPGPAPAGSPAPGP